MKPPTPNHTARGRFKTGNKAALNGKSRTGQRNKKTGRAIALQCLDKMLTDRRNVKRLQEDLELEFRADPTAFFKLVIMPLLPKESLLQLTSPDGKHGIKIIHAAEDDSSGERRSSRDDASAPPTDTTDDAPTNEGKD